MTINVTWNSELTTNIPEAFAMSTLIKGAEGVFYFLNCCTFFDVLYVTYSRLLDSVQCTVHHIFWTVALCATYCTLHNPDHYNALYITYSGPLHSVQIHTFDCFALYTVLYVT